MNILMVEDNDLNADMLGRRLARLGHEVQWVPTAEEVLELMPDLQADLMLLDVRLPGMNGIELARQIRAVRSDDELPLIAVTGDALPEVLQEAAEAGCCACLTKPIDFNRLLEVITQVTSKTH